MYGPEIRDTFQKRDALFVIGRPCKSAKPGRSSRYAWATMVWARARDKNPDDDNKIVRKGVKIAIRVLKYLAQGCGASLNLSINIIQI